MINPVVVTGDGSHSIRHIDLQVPYHSMHGAITESKHVFIHHGLEHISQNLSRIAILEIGFGTGLNAFLTYLFTIHTSDLSVAYTGIEKFPITAEIVSQLNYLNQLNAGSHHEVFEHMHQHKPFVHDAFEFGLFIGDIVDFSPETTYDLVYFDAFAPQAQPEMWSTEIFFKLWSCMNPGAILVTYCAQGQFKRTLKSLGFLIESLPGPPGKREMVRAMKG